MNQQKEYLQKCISAAKAARLVKSGDHVVIPGSVMVPWGFLRPMLKRKDSLRNVFLCHPTAWGDAFPYGLSEYQGSFRYKSFFLSANARNAWKENWGVDIVPVNLSAVSDLFDQKRIPADVVGLNTSPPDENGICSLGPYSVYLESAKNQAKLLILQINKYVPRTYGGSQVNLNEADYVYEYDEPLYATTAPESGEIEQKIASHIEPLVKDGDTLQIGRGSLPQAVIQQLKGKNDLGIHSELISDWLIDLMEEKIVTGAKKSHMPGISVGTIGEGDQRFYDYVHQNEKIHFKPSSYVNNPKIIAQNDNMVSINSAVEVDLIGQINAESVGTRMISGAGGQLDFAVGTNWSKNGRFIVAFSSTALNDKSSRIVSTFKPGTSITVPKTLADIIVTEYGAAHLKGKSMPERISALISIAHPKFREKLQSEAEELLYMQGHSFAKA